MTRTPEEIEKWQRGCALARATAHWNAQHHDPPPSFVALRREHHDWLLLKDARCNVLIERIEQYLADGTGLDRVLSKIADIKEMGK